MVALIIALPEEAEGIEGYPIYLSGCGKVNATIATMKAIKDGYKNIINFGSAGTVSNITGLVEVTGYVDRDMDARALNCELGQTPFEDGILIGKSGIVCGSGDKFATFKPEIACDIVDMEAYAIAKTCLKEEVSFRSFKYISDSVDENSASDWEENVHKGNLLFQEKLNHGL
jgi:adenosylhomocysteine nucleosidase